MQLWCNFQGRNGPIVKGYRGVLDSGRGVYLAIWTVAEIATMSARTILIAFICASACQTNPAPPPLLVTAGQANALDVVYSDGVVDG